MLNRMFFVSAVLGTLFCFADTSEIPDEVSVDDISVEVGEAPAEVNQADVNGESKSDEGKVKFFSHDGTVGSFSKVGFNRAAVDVASGRYPTESFSSIFAQFNTYYNLLAFIPTDSIKKLEIGIGASGGGLFIDSTLRDGAAFAGSGLSGGSGLNANYFGGYGGYLFDNFPGAYPYVHNRNIVIHNAYLDFSTKHFDFKAGRYESPFDYYSGYTQGFHLDYHTDIGSKANLKVWWFSSWGRAFAYSQWLLDFYSVKQSTLKDGSQFNYGNHGVGIDFGYGIIADSGVYKKGSNFFVRPFFHFYPGIFESPGLKISYEQQFGNGYGFSATIQGFYLHVDKEFTTIGSGGTRTRYDSSVDEHSANLNVILKANIHSHDLMIGYYQNFGSANSHFGTYGNPMGIDYWTGSVYDIGASISDIINRNAASVYGGFGGSYGSKYGTFSWNVLGRITRSPRSDENSVALTLTHTFNNKISLTLKAEWLSDTTKAGYNPGASLPGTSALSANRTDDRSHIFFIFDRPF